MNDKYVSPHFEILRSPIVACNIFSLAKILWLTHILLNYCQKNTRERRIFFFKVSGGISCDTKKY